jgi:hypothetical protein
MVCTLYVGPSPSVMDPLIVAVPALPCEHQRAAASVQVEGRDVGRSIVRR